MTMVQWWASGVILRINFHQQIRIPGIERPAAIPARAARQPDDAQPASVNASGPTSESTFDRVA